MLDAGCSTPHPPTHNHRDTESTEKSQSHQSTSQTRRHKVTKESQRPPSHPVFPQITQMDADPAQSLRLAHRSHRTPQKSTDPNTRRNRGERSHSTRFSGPATCALEERRPRLCFHFLESGEIHIPTQSRQNRHAVGGLVGEKAGCDERWRSEQTDFSPAKGDASSPFVLPEVLAIVHQFGVRPFVSLCLCGCDVGGWAGSASICVICGQPEWVGALCLRASTSLRSFLCVPLCASVPLWFTGGWEEIPNSEFRIPNSNHP
jgi:hypothetical protein